MTAEKNKVGLFSLLKQIFYQGKVVILPTDTIYGFSSLYGSGEQVLRELKNRETKPFIVLSDKEHLKDLCSEIPEIIENAWPAPLTVILKSNSGDKIAVRVPDDSFLLNLIHCLDKPIYSTSVNLSGEKPLTDFETICKAFESKVEIIIKDTFKDKEKPEIASTLLDATIKPYRLIRQGSYDAASLIANSN